MKMVRVPQPWAAAAVFGVVDVLNLPWKAGFTGPLVIAAGPPDPYAKKSARWLQRAFGHLPYKDVLDAVLGVVSLTDCVRGEECQLRYAVGPWCWLIRDALVLPKPIPWPRFDRIIDLSVDDELQRELEAAVWPAEWKDPDTKEHTPDANQVYPRRRDGWVGD